MLCVVTCGGCGKKSVPNGDDSSDPASPETTTTAVEQLEQLAPPVEVNAPIEQPTVVPDLESPDTQRIYRRSDDRAVVNQQRLNGTKVRRYESKRLILYTDLEPAIAETLPAYADELYQALVDFFGELPPNREGTGFQATGYLMCQQQTFRERNLWPQRVPEFKSGRHLGYEFWLFDQTKDYYRRHLMLHEFTHCFMSCVTGTSNAPPAWYMEGTAEFFATHRKTADGTQFGVMPENRKDYAGHDRIMSLNRVPVGSRESIADVAAISADDTMLYPWAWAACWFLMNHPATHEQFRAIGTHLTAAEFAERWELIARSQSAQLAAEWSVFVDQLRPGYDIHRGATRFAAGQSLAAGASVGLKVDVARGWQSTGVLLEADGVYRVEASGRFQVSDEPKPWISEANGVSIEYVGEHRLGCLLGSVFGVAKPGSLAKEFPVGSKSDLLNRAGVLYLRVNDRMNSLANNDGELAVKVTRLR